MKPFSASNYHMTGHSNSFGELNLLGKLHGRGIKISSGGAIYIGYWNNGEHAPGNVIEIWSGSDVYVGKVYLKDGKRWMK